MTVEEIASPLTGTGWTARLPARECQSARIVRHFREATATRDATVTGIDFAVALRVALALGSKGRPSPCRTDKRPTTRDGFKEAGCDAVGLRDLYRRYSRPAAWGPRSGHRVAATSTGALRRFEEFALGSAQ
jgi:hypothetical protein